MMELLTTFIITSSSLLLFLYWFRYTCLLILSARTTRDYAANVAMANQLNFLEVQSELRRSAADLNRLKTSLDRDYRVLTYLLNNAAIAAHGDVAVEERMLEIDYRIMRAWYAVSHNLAPSVACRALNEMSQVVAYFANSMGERCAVSAAA